jgi:hypothetical protein
MMSKMLPSHYGGMVCVGWGGSVGGWVWCWYNGSSWVVVGRLTVVGHGRARSATRTTSRHCKYSRQTHAFVVVVRAVRMVVVVVVVVAEGGGGRRGVMVANTQLVVIAQVLVMRAVVMMVGQPPRALVLRS